VLSVEPGGDDSRLRDRDPRYPSWEEFEERLASVLGRMQATSYLVISAPTSDEHSSYYVQFAQAGRPGFLAEAVSNHYLSGTAALSPAQEEQLGDLGWQWPTLGSDRDANFSRQWPMPVPFAEVARLAVRTFREVYGVPNPSVLTYRSFAKGGRPFAQPTLGIDPTPKENVRPESEPVVPTTEELKPLVEAAVKRFLDADVVHYDEQGDIPIRMGSALVFVRVVDAKPPHLAIFSPVLWGIRATPELFEALNELNTRIRFGRVFWTGREVMAALELPAAGVTAEDIAFACMQVGSIADHFDDELQGRFGGTTMFGPQAGPVQ